MAMISKRRFVTGCICCAGALSIGSEAAARQARFSVVPFDSDSMSPVCTLSIESGSDEVDGSNRPIDSTLESALKIVSRTLEIRPTITFVDDSETSPVMQTYLQRGSGVIGVGESMLNRIYSNGRYKNEILVGLLAHESAHVLQIERNCQLVWNGGGLQRGSCFKNLRPENGSLIGVELMADFMAGWTMARAGVLTTGEFEGFGKDLFERGDFYKSSRGHHGTPRNRLNFMASGYNFGKDGGELGYYEGDFIRNAGGDDTDFTSLDTAYLASQAIVVARRNRL